MASFKYDLLEDCFKDVKDEDGNVLVPVSSIIKQLGLPLKMSDERVKTASEPTSVMVKVPTMRNMICIKRADTAKFVKNIINLQNPKKRSVPISNEVSNIKKMDMLMNRNIMLFIDLDQTILINNNDAKGHVAFKPEFEVTINSIGKIEIELRPYIHDVLRDLEAHGFLLSFFTAGVEEYAHLIEDQAR